MRLRTVLSVGLLASAVLLGTTGCNFLVPQATLTSYNPSDGVSLHSGDVSLDNALWISEDGENAQLIGRFTNTGTEDETATLQIEVSGGAEKQSLTLTVPANGKIDLGADEQSTVVVDNLGNQPGTTASAYLQAGDAEGQSALVPVLNGELPEYASLVPTPVASASASADAE